MATATTAANRRRVSLVFQVCIFYFSLATNCLVVNYKKFLLRLAGGRRNFHALLNCIHYRHSPNADAPNPGVRSYLLGGANDKECLGCGKDAWAHFRGL